MAAKIMILNGPNLNFLGIREPHIYGRTTLDGDRGELPGAGRPARRLDLVPPVQHGGRARRPDPVRPWQTPTRSSSIPPAYSFTSIALIDALKIFEGPIIEVHISNIHARDELHRHSITSSACKAVICGLGPYGYSPRCWPPSTLGNCLDHFAGAARACGRGK